MPTKVQYKNIDEYIAQFPKDVQVIMQKLRTLIKIVVPDATEAISYQIPVFNLDGKYFIYFAGYKNHISLYPIHNGDSPFKEELEKHISGKGTAQFKLNEPFPFDLVKKIIEYKLKES